MFSRARKDRLKTSTEMLAIACTLKMKSTNTFINHSVSEKVMRQKVNYVTFNYFKDKPRLTTEEYAVIVQEFKTARQSKKPRYRKEDKRDDLGGDPLHFPYRYRWTGAKFYDQHWSSIAIGYNELEDARMQAEPARKIMFKLTSANKANDPGIATAVEVWLWTVSCHYEGKISQFNLKLQDKEPYISGENNWGKSPLPGQAGEFQKQLNIWLDNFCAIKSKRLTDYFDDSRVRMEEIYKSKHEVFDHIKSLDPPDQYTALTTISKNILLNEVYYDRAIPLYDDIIVRNVNFFNELQGRWFDILEQQADTMGPTIKGTPMPEILKKHAPGRLFDEQAFLKQKEAKQQKKTEKKSKLWPF